MWSLNYQMNVYIIIYQSHFQAKIQNSHKNFQFVKKHNFTFKFVDLHVYNVIFPSISCSL